MKDKEEKLIEAGMYFFGSKGISETRIEDITTRAGVAKGTFYTYFKSKEDLLFNIFTGLLEGKIDEFEKSIEEKDGIEEKLKYFVKNRFLGIKKDPKIYFFIQAFRNTESGRIIREENNHGGIKKRVANVLLNIFLKGSEGIKKEYREDIEIISATLLISLFHFQNLVLKKLYPNIDKEKDYEIMCKEIEIKLRDEDIEKYANQFYNLNVKELLMEG